MKKKLRFLIIFVFLFFEFIKGTQAQVPAWLWAKAMLPLDSYSYSDPFSMTVGPLNSDIYTVGYVYGEVDFNPDSGVFSSSETGTFILKLDSSGHFMWVKEVSYVELAHIACDTFGNIYLAGYFSGTIDMDPSPDTFYLSSNGLTDIFICKLDSSGNFIWAKEMGGGAYDRCYSIAVDPSGNGIYTAGYFENTVDFDPGSGVFNLNSLGYDDAFISKLNSSGNFVWAERIGGIDQQICNSLAVDLSGNVYTTGTFAQTANFDGINSLTASGPIGNHNIFVSKLDSSGNFIWAKKMGGTGHSEGYSVKLSSVGDVYTTGYFIGTGDFCGFSLTSAGSDGIFISKLDNSGNGLWAKGIGGENDEYGRDIAIDPSENGIYTIGEFHGTVDFDPGLMTYNVTSDGSIFISKLDSSGNFAWVKTTGGSINYYLSQGTSINVNSFGSIYAAGYFKGSSILFDSTTYQSPNHKETFIAKISPFCIQSAYYLDIDNDGYGINTDSVHACSAPFGYSPFMNDCDDSDLNVHPGAIEICNSIDDNCNGQIDENQVNYYADADVDGYGNATIDSFACTQPPGFVLDSTDCDDGNTNVHPGVIEICNGVDDNCNGQNDEGLLLTFYADADTDNYGNSSVDSLACSAPAGYVTDSTDCNDGDSNAHPGATEIPNNGIDDDCDGLIDEICAADFYLVPDTLLQHHYWAINLATGVGPLTYLWSWGDGTYDSIAYPSHIYAAAGFYTICLTIHDTTGCTDSTCINYNIQKLSAENTIVKVDVVDTIPSIPTTIENTNVLQSWSVFPNPASGNSFINYTLSTPATVSIALYDVLGNKLQQLVNGNQPQGEHNATIDARKLANGVYVLQIRAGEQVAEQKIVVMN